MTDLHLVIVSLEFTAKLLQLFLEPNSLSQFSTASISLTMASRSDWATLPQTLEALTHGRISEWRATLIIRETATLTREDRLQVDAELAPQLEGAGDRRVADLARKIAYRLDPGAALRRSPKAETDRHRGSDRGRLTTGL